MLIDDYKKEALMKVMVISTAKKPRGSQRQAGFRKRTGAAAAADIYVHVGENIRSMRNSLRLSTKELAYNAGITASFLNNIENANRKATLYTFEKIARALDVELRDLIGMQRIKNPIPKQLIEDMKLKSLITGLDEDSKKRLYRVAKAL
ncbi:MAG TPA: helix-turn-helix domain-containing protein [bacterium]|nr:helix-turn-helix domain-containing protein [bacterium]